MKRTVPTLIFSLLTAASTWAQDYDFKYGDLYYNITDEAAKTVEVTYETYYGGSPNYSSIPYVLTIPSTVTNNGTEYSVTAIGSHTFHFCDVTQVNIPNSVTDIKDYAFSCCYSLTQVNIPNSVTHIGEEAFSSCYDLIQVSIPNSVTNIGNRTFYNCEKLKQVTIGNSVTSIGEQMFYGCFKLTQVTIGSYVTNIGDEAFSHCFALAQITIPESVTSIGNDTFAYCRTLTQVTINNNVKSIGDRTFAFCRTLTQVTIGNSVKNIGEEIFLGCSALTQVIIGNSVESIGNRAFAACKALVAIHVNSDNSTYCSENGILFNKDKTVLLHYPIGKPEATYIIPSSVTSIGNGAFTGCAALTQITIPESVSHIGNYAFADCKALWQVTINSNVTNIGNGTFAYCSALRQMNVLPLVPPTVGYDTFYAVNHDILVYVPAEALAAYQMADVWKEFNLQGVATSMYTPSIPKSICVHGGILYNPLGLPVSIYDMQGRQVYNGTSTTISQPTGVYIVRSTGASSKVLF